MTSPPLSQSHQVDPSIRRNGATRLTAFLGCVAAVSLLIVLAGCGRSTRQVTASSTVTPSTTLVRFRQPGDPNEVICRAAMVRKIDDQLTEGRVVGKPQRATTATATICTYRLDNGSLQLRVDNATNHADAARRYANLRRSAGAVTGVAHLGTSAFTTSEGTTVTIVDNQVLTVDLTRIPPANDRAQIGQSLSFQILTRFNG